MNIRGPERSYHLFPNFYAPGEIDSPQMDNIVHLINALDGYRVVRQCSFEKDNSQTAERDGDERMGHG